MRYFLVPLLALPLGGCFQTFGAAPSVRTVTVCQPVREISAADQKRIAAELRSLPSNSALRSIVVPDWVKGRDQSRACINARNARVP
jgi:hypothetical protein